VPDEPTQLALAIFDALCERRLRELVDDELISDAMDALAAPGRAAEVMTRLVAPLRQGVLARQRGDLASSPLSEAIPAGVLELVIALLPSLPPPPRELVERAIGSPEVRAEVRRLLEETVGELMSRVTGSRGPRGVIGWGARAASAAGRGLFGALGGDLESKLGDAVDFGVSFAQKRIVELIASPESARRVGKELAHLAPRLVEVKEAEIARMLERVKWPLIDGLIASLLSHNATRPRVRAIVLAEHAALVERLSETTIGELLERFGLRAPLRAFTGRQGGRVVEQIAARLRRDRDAVPA